MRRYGDDIEVRSGAGRAAVGQEHPGGPDAQGHEGQSVPEIFLWRGRLYLVRDVLDHWVQRRPWWREVLEPAGRAPARELGGRAEATAVSCPPAPTFTVADLEHEVWRVEAAAGASCAAGVYDLLRSVDGGGESWRLLSASD